MSTILAQISAEGFNILNHKPTESDNDIDRATKLAFLQEVADLKNDSEFNGFAQNIQCMTNCVVEYLQCVRDNPSYPPQAICDTYFSNCLANCGTV